MNNRNADFDRFREAAPDDEIHAVGGETIDALPSTIARPPTRPLTARRSTTTFCPTAWPHVGGRDLQVQPTGLFTSAAFLDQWRDGGERRAIYAAGCLGARDLAIALGRTVYKVSTTSPDNLWRRMHEMRCDSYGAVWMENGEWVEDMAGWRNWFASQLKLNLRQPSPGAPVEVGLRTISVRLPDGMSPANFDEAFDRRTASACLDDWAASDDGLAHCKQNRLDPHRFRRHTAYPGGDTPRLSPAREIAVFSVFLDTDRLVQIAEEIILEHYGLAPTRVFAD